MIDSSSSGGFFYMVNATQLYLQAVAAGSVCIIFHDHASYYRILRKLNLHKHNTSSIRSPHLNLTNMSSAARTELPWKGRLRAVGLTVGPSN